ncbi:hypothetical protein ACINK0_06460 [Deinococcus sp. VB343]|uniref:hypothetical protein n=1 Tax=Deinococcus sp. VB343 TaxID=3385567 RepID=UPI0039C9E4C7
MARRLGAAYLRVDSMEAALLNAGQERVKVERGGGLRESSAGDAGGLGRSRVAGGDTACGYG